MPKRRNKAKTNTIDFQDVVESLDQPSSEYGNMTLSQRIATDLLEKRQSIYFLKRGRVLVSEIEEDGDIRHLMFVIKEAPESARRIFLEHIDSRNRTKFAKMKAEEKLPGNSSLHLAGTNERSFVPGLEDLIYHTAVSSRGDTRMLGYCLTEIGCRVNAILKQSGRDMPNIMESGLQKEDVSNMPGSMRAKIRYGGAPTHIIFQSGGTQTTGPREQAFYKLTSQAQQRLIAVIKSEAFKEMASNFPEGRLPFFVRFGFTEDEQVDQNSIDVVPDQEINDILAQSITNLECRNFETLDISQTSDTPIDAERMMELLDPSIESSNTLD